MKKTAILLSSLLVCGSLYAADWNAKPLIGVELGFGGTDVKRTTTPLADSTEDSINGGLKVGAESGEYRVFLSGRYYDIDGFDSVTSVGGEFQYLIPLQEELKLFLGVNGGMMDMEFKSSQGLREISTAYVGGDAGLNFEISQKMNLDAGVRYMLIDYDHTMGSPAVTYNIDKIVQGYIGLNFVLPAN